MKFAHGRSVYYTKDDKLDPAEILEEFGNYGMNVQALMKVIEEVKLAAATAMRRHHT